MAVRTVVTTVDWKAACSVGLKVPQKVGKSAARMVGHWADRTVAMMVDHWADMMVATLVVPMARHSAGQTVPTMVVQRGLPMDMNSASM